MAEETGEQDRSEQATPFKLERARRKGMLARGTDLGFFSVLLALAIIAQTAGQDLVVGLTLAMKHAFAGQIAMAGEGGWTGAVAGRQFASLATLLVLPALLLVTVCLVVEVVQNRGIIFTAEPLKPDFSKLNPAKGLKRLLSVRMLKELAKNVVKLALYATAAAIFVRQVAMAAGREVRNGRQLAEALVHTSGRLLLMFIILAAIVAVIDQLMTRREFARQMRMSQREVKREIREREGEPRQKQKRKQILDEILKQAAAAANVKGADILIVNPTHYAVALRYRAEENAAPVVQARGRNLWARRMRQAAEREGIVIVRNPALARALYRNGQVGRAIGQGEFVAVADIYIMLRRTLQQTGRS